MVSESQAILMITEVATHLAPYDTPLGLRTFLGFAVKFSNFTNQMGGGVGVACRDCAQLLRSRLDELGEVRIQGNLIQI